MKKHRPAGAPDNQSRQLDDDTQAFRCFRRVRGVPTWIVVGGSWIAVFWAYHALYEYQHPAARAARRVWNLESADRIKAIYELEGSGWADAGVAIPALVSALDDTDPKVRAVAARGLVSTISGADGGIAATGEDFDEALRGLVRLLDDQEPAVRAVATDAVWMVLLVNNVAAGEIDREPAANGLIEQLDDPDPHVRASAIRGLGIVGPSLFGDPPARLIAAMDIESGKGRDEAIESLAAFHHGLPRVIPALVKSAECAAPPARAGYLKLLSRIRPPSFSSDAVPGLISGLASQDAEIVAIATAGLREFKADVPLPVRSALVTNNPGPPQTGRRKQSHGLAP